MARYDEVRVRELTDRGSWPWRYVVEGKRLAYFKKRWPWSREAAVLIPERWEQLPHALRGLEPCEIYDANALADHYRRQIQDAPND